MSPFLAAALLACGLVRPALAAEEKQPVVMADTDSDAGKVFRAKGGPDRAVVPGGAVIIDASGERLEIAPTKRAAPPAPVAAPALPELPTLDDPKAGLAERRRRAQLLLGGSVAATCFLVAWARRRWRPDV